MYAVSLPEAPNPFGGRFNGVSLMPRGYVLAEPATSAGG